MAVGWPRVYNGALHMLACIQCRHGTVGLSTCKRPGLRASRGKNKHYGYLAILCICGTPSKVLVCLQARFRRCISLATRHQHWTAHVDNSSRRLIALRRSVAVGLLVNFVCRPRLKNMARNASESRIFHRHGAGNQMRLGHLGDWKCEDCGTPQPPN